MANRELITINQRLSLRPPQTISLEILADVLDIIELRKGADPVAALSAIRSTYPQVSDFEREFPSLCFALATGVGKTRLMGAFIAYLYLTGKSREKEERIPSQTVMQLRAAWMESGPRWWSTADPPPAGWDPYRQVLEALRAN